MKIRWKVAASIASVASAACLALCVFVYTDGVRHERRQFLENYRAKLEIIEETLVQSERAADYMAENALRAWRERIQQNGLESNEDLSQLAHDLHVEHLFATDAAGHFIRSTNGPTRGFAHSVFDYCDDYRNLLSDTSSVIHTPMVPTTDELTPGPFKYTLMGSPNGNGIIEASTLMPFVNNTLASALRADSAIRSLTLYSSKNGDILGHMGRPLTAPIDPALLGSTDITRWQDNTLLLTQRVQPSVRGCCECVTLHLADTEDGYTYRLVADISTRDFDATMAATRNKLAALCGLLFVISLGVGWVVSRYLVNKLEAIAEGINDITSRGDLTVRLPVRGTDEIAFLATRINTMSAALAETQKCVVEAEKLRVAGEVASQAAHDIRSPLAAVTMALRDLGSVPEETRNVLRGGISRITDIANELMQKRRGTDTADNDSSNSHGPVLISSVVEALVSEKRTQYRSRLGVSIEDSVDSNAYGLFASIDPSELKRALSNVIDHVISSLPVGGGRITIEVQPAGESLAIGVYPGEDSSTLASLQQLPASMGHTSRIIQSAGGALRLAGTEQQRVTITLPIALQPPWFLPRIRLQRRNQVVVVVDDDATIHWIWEERLGRLGADKPHVVHVSTPDELRQWVRTTALPADLLFLVDYELLGHSATGLDLIEELGLGAKAALVTSRFEEPHIVKRCQDLRVKLIPKPAASYVPIGFVEKPAITAALDAVLIDNDPLVRQVWQLSSRRSQRRLKTFSSSAAFLNESETIDVGTPIYIDSELEHGEKGEQTARLIGEQGFASIFLVTGRPARDFPPMPWLKDVLGKDPPF